MVTRVSSSWWHVSYSLKFVRYIFTQTILLSSILSNMISLPFFKYLIQIFDVKLLKEFSSVGIQTQVSLHWISWNLFSLLF